MDLDAYWLDKKLVSERTARFVKGSGWTALVMFCAALLKSEEIVGCVQRQGTYHVVKLVKEAILQFGFCTVNGRFPFQEMRAMLNSLFANCRFLHFL